jgi:hypothetical protein
MLCISLLIIITLLIPSNILDSNKLLHSIIPSTAQLQYAGNVGLGSIGAGYNITSRTKLNFIYGYLPKWVNNTEVQTVALKGTYDIIPINLNTQFSTTTYTGATLMRSFAHNAYVKFPDYYPKDYYFSNAVHIAPLIGQSLTFKQKKNLSIYAELSTLDYYFYYYMINKHIDFQDIWNISFGITLNLKPLSSKNS